MFEKLKECAEVKIKEIVGNLEGTDTLLLDKKDTGSKCYWEGFIKGLESAEEQIKGTINDLRSEGDEYQKNLDKIDELALLIENAIKRIREKI